MTAARRAPQTTEKKLTTAVADWRVQRLLDARRGLPNPVHRLLTAHGQLFAMADTGDPIADSVANQGGWQSGLMDLVADICDPSWTALEVGAHFGVHTCRLARLCASVLAVEASPTNFPFLVSNLERNHIRNVDPQYFVATDRFGTVAFTDKANSLRTDASGPLSQDDAMRPMEDGARSLIWDLQGFGLDDLYGRGRQFDLIKIDVGNTPEPVLRGGRRLLEKARAVLIDAPELTLEMTEHLTNFRLLKVQVFPETAGGYALHPLDAPVDTRDYLALRRA